MKQELLNCFEAPLDLEQVHALQRDVDAAGQVLYLADNAGEIVFDRPLLDIIGPDKVTVAGVLDRIEIWDTTAFEEDKRKTLDRLFEIQQSVDRLPSDN